MDELEINDLLSKHLKGIADTAEQEGFMAFVREENNMPVLSRLLEEQWAQYHTGQTIGLEKSELLFQSILKAAAILAHEPEAPVVSMMRRYRVWFTAAAVVLMMFVGWWFLVRGTGDGGPESGVGGQGSGVVTDVSAPTMNKARVTLSDGRTVSLDSIQNGLLADQNGIQLVKTADGQITYQYPGLRTPDSGPTTPDFRPRYNTLTNPRGSKVIDLTLADGSRVWLNAGSSITYPIAFVGNERRVSITGEAYFEVVASPNLSKGGALRSFIVEKGDMQVQVLGTHFNVNAYDDESDIKVTLLEGSVNVNGTMIRPGQQAQLGADGKITTLSNVIMDEVTGWRNGWFHFESADLKAILRQFARWYDVEIIYEGPVKNRKFFALVKRSSTLKSVLEMLQDNNISYRIEGRKLRVKSG